MKKLKINLVVPRMTSSQTLKVVPRNFRHQFPSRERVELLHPLVKEFSAKQEKVSSSRDFSLNLPWIQKHLRETVRSLDDDPGTSSRRGCLGTTLGTTLLVG